MTQKTKLLISLRKEPLFLLCPKLGGGGGDFRCSFVAKVCRQTAMTCNVRRLALSKIQKKFMINESAKRDNLECDDVPSVGWIETARSNFVWMFWESNSDENSTSHFFIVSCMLRWRKLLCNGTLWYSKISQFWNFDTWNLVKISNSMCDVALSMRFLFCCFR